MTAGCRRPPCSASTRKPWPGGRSSGKRPATRTRSTPSRPRGPIRRRIAPRTDVVSQWINFWGGNHVREVTGPRIGSNHPTVRLLDRPRPGRVEPADLILDPAYHPVAHAARRRCRPLQDGDHSEVSGGRSPSVKPRLQPRHRDRGLRGFGQGQPACTPLRGRSVGLPFTRSPPPAIMHWEDSPVQRGRRSGS